MAKMLGTDNLFSLEGRVALITGGNGGLGLAIARGLRSAGASVAVTGRDPAKNEAASREFGSDAVFELDVRDEDRVGSVTREIVGRFGSFDVLVNNAGVGLGGAVEELAVKTWDEVVGSHLRGAFLCSKHAVPLMRARGGGKIVNVGSMFSLFGPPGFSPYAAAKTGMLGLTRALAVELAPTIQVNAVLPAGSRPSSRATHAPLRVATRSAAARRPDAGASLRISSARRSSSRRPHPTSSPALRCRSTAATRSPSDSSTTKDRGDEPPSAAPPTLSEGAGRGTALRRGSCRGR
jgi:2-dehydro-3-deoxy-D-gluconate 5-dehydrogenase